MLAGALRLRGRYVELHTHTNARAHRQDGGYLGVERIATNYGHERRRRDRRYATARHGGRPATRPAFPTSATFAASAAPTRGYAAAASHEHAAPSTARYERRRHAGPRARPSRARA